jgi:nitrogen fixation protein NifU and related proteins
VSLDDLYREVILDHYSHPRNHGRLDPHDVAAEGANPLCGDELTVFVRVADGRIDDVRFIGHGCSISQSSASMMTEAVKGRSLEEARGLIEQFKAMMHGREPSDELGDLAALQGVRKFPVRIKCATLPWVTLQQGLDERTAGVAGVATTDTRQGPAAP